jgi:hypothetical protein
MADQRNRKDTQRDKMDRPEPGLQPVEGDEETIEQDLKDKEKKPKTRTGGGTA